MLMLMLMMMMMMVMLMLMLMIMLRLIIVLRQCFILCYAVRCILPCQSMTSLTVYKVPYNEYLVEISGSLACSRDYLYWFRLAVLGNI
jgi:hypothetical protein